MYKRTISNFVDRPLTSGRQQQSSSSATARSSTRRLCLSWLVPALVSQSLRLPEDHPYVQDEYKEIASSVSTEIEIAHSSSWLGLFRELKNDRTLLRRFVLVMIVQIGFNFSGGNSITYYQTSILSTINVTTTDGAYLFSGIYGLMKVLAVLVYAFLLSERFGRRKMLLIGATISILCVLWIAIYLGALAGLNKAAGWVAIVAVCLFAIGYGIGWAPVAFGLNGEAFPNRIRAKIMSLTIGMQYLANFCLTRLFPNMVSLANGKTQYKNATLIIFYFFLDCQHWLFRSLCYIRLRLRPHLGLRLCRLARD